MNDCEKFLETLKILQFPEVNKFKPSDFENAFSDDDLKPLLEFCCTFKDENVLTSEEIEEFASISQEELVHFEKLSLQDNFFENEKDEEKESEEVKYLENHLSLIEDHVRVLQHQKDLLKDHQNYLHEEKHSCEKLLTEAKKAYDVYALQKVPQAENELVTVLQSISALITTESDYSLKTPVLNFKDLESYCEEELKLLNHVHIFFQKQFDTGDESECFNLRIPGYTEDHLLKEMKFLQKVMKTSKMTEIELRIEKEKIAKILENLKSLKDGFIAELQGNSTSQLWEKLAEENELLTKYTEKENVLKMNLSTIISEQIDAECNRVGIIRSKEVMQTFNASLEKIRDPLDHMVSQRSRLELILFCLNSFDRKFKRIKYLIDNASTFIENDKQEFLLRKSQYEEELLRELPPQNVVHLPEKSLLVSVYKIFSDADHQTFSSITINDVLRKAEHFYLGKERLEKDHEKKLNILKILEEKRSQIERYALNGKEFSVLLQKEENFNVNLNKLNLKLTALQKKVVDCQNFMEQKRKVLEKNRNMRLARCLYIYALLERDVFENWIDQIKDAAESTVEIEETE